MPFVGVIHMIMVRDGHVAASGAVPVWMILVRPMLAAVALVHVVFVEAVQMAVMQVIDMILMLDCGMATVFSMSMRMPFMRIV